MKAKLTYREIEVLQAIYDFGHPFLITAHLDMSHSTVRAHLRQIREKLGVNTTLEAVILFVKSGLVKEK